MSSYKNLEALVEKYVHKYEALSLVLESVQQERDEYRDLYSSSQEKLEATERERDELRKTLQATQDGATEAIKHAMRLQEDIARRDAAAAAAAAASDILRWDAEKPIAEVAESFIYFLRKQPNGERWPVGTKLYTAAPPAVLPPDVIYKAQHIASVLEMIGSFDSDDIDSDTVDSRFEVDGVDTGSDASITEYATKGAEIIRTLVMGAQQQKVVVMPGTKCIGWVKEAIQEHDAKWVAALDAAGVKWEVKK